MLASGLWGPIENVKIDPSLWPPGTLENLDTFVQRRLTDGSRVVSSDANLGRGRRGRFDRSLKK